jgi:hypothetical protein
MALLWQLFSKELGMQDSLIKVSESNDTTSDEYHSLVAKIKKLVNLETTLEASNYLKCIHRYFIEKEQEKIRREEEDYEDDPEIMDARLKRIEEENETKKAKRAVKAITL